MAGDENQWVDMEGDSAGEFYCEFQRSEDDVAVALKVE